METVFSGIQPSSELHRGNALGAVRNGVCLQNTYTWSYCILDNVLAPGTARVRPVARAMIERM